MSHDIDRIKLLVSKIELEKGGYIQIRDNLEFPFVVPSHASTEILASNESISHCSL